MSFFAEVNILTFLIFTCLVAGAVAWASGRAIAISWRPFWQVIVYMLLFAAVVRFFHYSLFNGTLLTLHYYLVDAVVLLIIASLGYRMTRTNQMVNQYRWMYKRATPFHWALRKS